MRLALVELLIRRSIRRVCDGPRVVPVRRVIVRDDLGRRSDRRSGCCQRCCQLVDHVDPRRQLRDCRWCVAAALAVQRAAMHVGTRRYLGLPGRKVKVPRWYRYPSE